MSIGAAARKLNWTPLPVPSEKDALTSELEELLIGQPAAIPPIVSRVIRWNSGLGPVGRPAGVFMLLGPTGVGKTRTPEVLAQVLHGSEKQLMRIDCAEFENRIDVAKLIGAPPGYLGHKETPPIMSQHAINAVSSSQSDLSIIVLDEIEKAHHSFTQFLLAVLDKASLRLGDNSKVNFERCLIFLTSNLGSKEMQAEKMGFGEKPEGFNRDAGMKALRIKYSPEFLNRLDNVIVYESLTRESCEAILAQLVNSFRTLIRERLGLRGEFSLEVSYAARERLLDLGVSADYGARELRRTFEKHAVDPICSLVSAGVIRRGSSVMLDCEDGEFVFLEKR